MRFYYPLLLLTILSINTLLSSSHAQSLWLETGIGYHQQNDDYPANFKAGVRITYPITETLSIFIAPSIQQGLTIDAGTWFSFEAGSDDIPRLQSHLGTGLTFSNGNIGLALSGALSYQANDNLELAIIYTHRPLVLPELSQAFDLSLALKINLD